MSTRYPRIRIQAESGYTLACEAVHFCFYIRRPHREITHEVWCALQAYLHAVGPRALTFYADYEGEWQTLDESGWSLTRQWLFERPGGLIHLGGSSGEGRFAFDYYGSFIGDSSSRTWPDSVCAVSFRLPMKYLEEHGPERVRTLALQLAAPLPLSSGHVGLAICGALDFIGVMAAVREYCFRYPGLDIEEVGYTAMHIGTRVRGPAWLTFLGQPALGALGGISGLRDKLHSPGTTVEELDGGRAVITLGAWPEAGDVEQGNRLPAYRELARVLEPWLYIKEGGMRSFSPEEAHAWKRRFLD